MQRFLLLFSVLIVRTILFPIDGMDYDIYIYNECTQIPETGTFFVVNYILINSK